MIFKSIFALACLIAVVSAATVQKLPEEDLSEVYKTQPETLIRHARSPGDGSLQIEYNQDRNGKRADVQYNQNVYKSDDGRFKVDAYAGGSRDFTRNQNSYGGGVRGSYSFGR